jgi:signal transduction histidine kinase
MVSITNASNTHPGDLARQNLLLRPALILLLGVVALWVAESRLPLLLALGAYTASSLVLALGYRSRLLGSSDVVYFGMVDTNLFVGAGVLFTGGLLSPVLFLFFGMQATYFVLANPKTSIIAAIISMLVMTASAALSGSLPALPPVDPLQHPLAYLTAAIGALAMLSSVGWLHSALYATRSQAHRHLALVLHAWRRLVGADAEGKELADILGSLMATLNVTDEGAVYRYDAPAGVLRLEAGMGIRPWFQKFQSFSPGEGIVGRCYCLKQTLICRAPAESTLTYVNLSRPNLEILKRAKARAQAPRYCLAVPIVWEDEALGVLLLSRQQGSLNENEAALVEGFAAHLATAMQEYRLDQELARLYQEVEVRTRLHDLLQGVDGSPEGLAAFARRLQTPVPFEAARIALALDDELEPDLGCLWCAEGLPLDRPPVDAQVRRELSARRPDTGFLVQVENTLPTADEPAADGGVDPALAQQGVTAVAGVSVQTALQGGPSLRGILLLFFRDAGGSTDRYLPMLNELRPVLAQLTRLLAAWGRWQQQSRQMESIQDILSLTMSCGNEQGIVQTLIKGVARQTGGEDQVTVAAILFNPKKGSIIITQAAGDTSDGLKHLPAGEHFAGLKELMLQQDHTEVLDIPAESPEARTLADLLGAPQRSCFRVIPLRHADKALGMVLLVLPEDARLTRSRQDTVRQLARVAALCLQISRQSEAQSRQNRELQHEDELRRSFLSYITHEFRTPLASLKTSFELIQESEKVRHLEDPYQRLLINVNRSVSTLEELTNDLSEVANISAGGVILNRSLTSPDSIVYPVLETTAPLSHLKNQKLEIEIPPDLPPLMADARRLEQVLTNMVSNAIKYTPEGGSIRATVCRENGSIKFLVSDTGPGIPEEDLERVFQPFYRVPQQAKLRTPGTGLGLALAKSLVELHGGKIWVESGPQKGSTFCFTIPIESRTS